MAELFDVSKSTVSEHLSNIYASNELLREATVREFRTVQTEGIRKVNRNLEYYNLDAIISVGYRVNSAKATQFRIWATQTLKEFIIKGFVIDDQRLKQGQTAFGKIILKNCCRESVLFGQVSDAFISRLQIFLRNAVSIFD